MTVPKEAKEGMELAVRQTALKQSNEEIAIGIEGLEYMLKILKKVLKERGEDE